VPHAKVTNHGHNNNTTKTAHCQLPKQPLHMQAADVVQPQQQQRAQRIVTQQGPLPLLQSQ
jgi:hypothetical protein